MVRQRAFPHCNALFLATLLASCVTVPEKVENAHNLRFIYRDFKSDEELVLVNQGHVDFGNIYSQPESDAKTKVAPNETLVELVNFAASHDFFENAVSSPAGQRPPSGGAFRMLVLEADGRTFAFAQRAGLERSSIQSFLDIQTEFNLIYNSLFQLQYIDSSTDGSNRFDEERRRLEEQNRGTVERGGGE